jgi:Sortase domain
MSAGVRAALLAALALLVATPLAGSQAAARDEGRMTVAGRTTSATTDPPTIDSFRSTRTYPAAAGPVRVRIPAIRVDSGLQPLGRAADGSIDTPVNPDVAGWYAEGPRPGQPGPAVIIGHVDSHDRAAVFFRLTELAPGALVYVDRADGTTATFRVTGQSRVPKTQFPTDVVYWPTLQPSLRLVTCGGGFDRSTGSYRENVIVFAVLA